MFKKILVPVDISHPELSNPAIETATRLSKGGNKVRLVTILPVVPSMITAYLPNDFEHKQHTAILAELKKVADNLKIPDVDVTYNIRSGAVHTEVLDEAEDWGAELIIMGSSRPDLTTYILGTHAGDIVRHAKCSVMVIRN